MQAVSAKFLLLHSTILKPYFDLSVGEVQQPRQLQAFFFVDVDIEEKFSLKFPDLIFGIGTSFLSGSQSSWWKNVFKKLQIIFKPIDALFIFLYLVKLDVKWRKT